MESRFNDDTVLAALDRSVRNARFLKAKDAAAVAAARALARKIDAWDVIAQWALEDCSGEKGARPAVPQNDNVSLASFLKYLDLLGLVPNPSQSRPAGRGQEQAEPRRRNDFDTFLKEHKVG